VKVPCSGKDDVTQQYLQQFDADEGLLYVGRAQEKARVVRTERRRSVPTGVTYPWGVDGSAMVNHHYYFYCVGEDFGPFFLKLCSYFPCNAKLCINGNECAKCQVRKRGISFEALDNGSILQAEFALIQVLDRQVAGRMLSEQVIRENLDIGRPGQVQLIFDRPVNRRTPGRLRTGVITEGVTRSPHADGKRSRTSSTTTGKGMP
jgi:hypothetical protein